MPISNLLPYTTLFRSRRRIAQNIAAPAGKEIEIAVALRVPNEGAFATHQTDGVAGVVGNHVLVEQFDRLLGGAMVRSEEHTSELQSRENLVCRLLLEK